MQRLLRRLRGSRRGVDYPQTKDERLRQENDPVVTTRIGGRLKIHRATEVAPFVDDERPS